MLLKIKIYLYVKCKGKIETNIIVTIAPTFAFAFGSHVADVAWLAWFTPWVRLF